MERWKGRHRRRRERDQLPGEACLDSGAAPDSGAVDPHQVRRKAHGRDCRRQNALPANFRGVKGEVSSEVAELGQLVWLELLSLSEESRENHLVPEKAYTAAAPGG